jgi:hypothetical protein
VWYFHNVFGFVFVCNVSWVEFQQRRGLLLLLLLLWDIWLLLWGIWLLLLLLLLLGEREEIGGIVT